MNVLINKGRRRLGIPGRPAIILDAGANVTLTDEQLESIQENRTVTRWLEVGVLEITDGSALKADKQGQVPRPKTPKPRPAATPRRDDERDVEKLPEGVTGDGVEMHHLGGGWWQVFVNGFKVTDRNVRKDEAKSIAAEYE
jgi:hypothetical protein